MPDVVDASHLQAAARFRRLWSAYEENRDLLLMGAYVPGSDAALDEAIARREAMLEFLRQAPSERIPLETARGSLIEAFGA
jgi:flagellum-specific ATP synthase